MSQDSSTSAPQLQDSLNWTIENEYFRDKAVTLSGDGTTLAVYDEGIISIWRLKGSLFSDSAPGQNQALRELKNLGQDEQLAPLAQLNQNSCSSIALSNDGQILASGSQKGEVLLWQVSTQKSSCLSSKHQNLVTSVVFSRDGSNLASGDHEKIKLWNIGNYQKIDDIFRGFGWIYALAFSLNGELLASTSEARIYLWDLKLKQRRDPVTLEPRNQITALVFNPVHENQIACGTREGKIVLLNLDHRKKTPLTIPAHSQRVNLLAFSPNGQTLISGSPDGIFKSWQIATPSQSPPGDWIDQLSDNALSEDIERMSKKSVPNQGQSTDKNLSNISRLMVLTDEECKQELQDLLKARVPLIFLRSSEEERAINYVIHAHRNAISNLNIKDGELAQWSSIDGFSQASFIPPDSPKFVNWNKIKSSTSLATTASIQGALTFLIQQLETASKESEKQHTYILPDWPVFLEERATNSQTLTRQLRELTMNIKGKGRDSQPRMTIIILGSSWSIPSILQDHVHLVYLPPPEVAELHPVFREVIPQDWNPELVDQLSEDAKGMPVQVARQAAELIKIKNLKDIKKAKELLLKIKQQEVKKMGVLEYCISKGKGLEDVGGLDNLKSWIQEQQRWFKQNDDPKLRPRAILLEGYPGCGKSFIANAIAKEWNIPQIKFEISRLKSKFVGETENKTFEALKIIDASAPCILFIDEIEKAFAGVETDTSGVANHQFGTVLSWLNDHLSPVFVIATSNNSEKLPPELFRSGRFDKRFIFLLPTQGERCQILQNQIHDYLPDIEGDFGLDKLESELDLVGFSSAELEQLVKETVRQCPKEIPPRLPTQEEWKQARKQIHPQIKSPVKKKLLQQYLNKIKADGESASKLDEKSWAEFESLAEEPNPDEKNNPRRRLQVVSPDKQKSSNF